MKKSPAKLSLSRETLGRIEGGTHPVLEPPSRVCASGACTFTCICSADC